MRWVRAVLVRLRDTFTHGDEEDVRAELEAHVELETAEYIRRGMAPAEARRRALLASGGLTQAADAVRDQRGLPWLENLIADLRYATRALTRTPVFTLVVVATLALGIGVNTAIFSVVNGVLLKPLPHRDGDRLVYLRHSMVGPGGANITFSVPEVRDLRTGVPSFAGLAEYSPWRVVHRSADGAARVEVGLVTGNYFEVMGLSPVLGRLTTPADDGAGVPPVAVLTHDFWVNRFGADPAVLGTQLRLDGQSVTVIGVLEPAPFFPDRIAALLNMVISDHHLSATMVEGRTHRMTEVVARLAPGASLDQARAEVATVEARIHRDYPDAYAVDSRQRIDVIPFRDAMGERARLPLLLLMGAAAIVLIIAAANVANLTLMRGVRRQQELVVRAALGAGVTRLRRLLLVENLVLTTVGGAVGVLVALGAVDMLTAFADRYSTRAGEVGLDVSVLGFALALSLGLALILSVLASLPREGAFAAAMGAGARRGGGSPGNQRLMRGLVVVQVAVSVMLLAGAGLLTRTMQRIAAVDTGLQTEAMLTMEVSLLNLSELFDPAADGAAKERYERIRRELAALPGVIDVGVGSPMPLRSAGVRFDVKAENRPPASGDALPRAEVRIAGPEYFRAAGIPIVRGRAFRNTDRPGAGRVVIINQALADQLFAGEDPIGKRIAWTGDVLRFTPISADWRTVVGVTATTQDGGLDAQPRAAVFMPFAQELAMGGGFVLRTDGDAAALASAATRIVRREAPGVPIENVMTIAQYKDRSIAPRRLNAALLSSFSVLAAAIAAVGIAGVLAFSVSARTGEIGIRMSLGADRARVQRMILREGGSLLVVGLLLGAVGGFLAARVIEGLLFDVAPHDPPTFAGVVLIMAAVGLAACWIPARRAARVDPATAMRV